MSRVIGWTNEATRFERTRALYPSKPHFARMKELTSETLYFLFSIFFLSFFIGVSVQFVSEVPRIGKDEAQGAQEGFPGEHDSQGFAGEARPKQ